MKCQNLFSGKNKTNGINVSSAELAQRMVKINQNTSLICSFESLKLFDLFAWNEFQRSAADTIS